MAVADLVVVAAAASAATSNHPGAIQKAGASTYGEAPAFFNDHFSPINAHMNERCGAGAAAALSNLTIVDDGFADTNSLAGDSFSLADSPDGKNLYMTFRPAPEPTSFACTAFFASGMLLRRKEAVKHIRRGIGTFIWEPTRHHEAIFSRHRAMDGEENAGTKPGTVGAPGHRPRTGRFDTNDLIDLYLQMARDFAGRSGSAAR